MLRILKSNRPITIILIGVLTALMWLSSLLDPSPPETEYHMPFYRALVSLIDQLPLVSTILALTLNLIIAITLVRLNVRFFLIDARTYMPAAFYLMVATANPDLHHISPILIAGIFLLFTLIILLNASAERPNSLRIFNASLVLVAGSLFYLKLIWFVPFIWIAISYLRPIRWREVLYPFIAYMMLGLFLLTYYWVFREDLGMLTDLLEKNLGFGSGSPDFTIPWMISYGWVLFLIFLASLFIIRKFQTGKIIVRKIYLVLFFLFLYSLVFFLLIAPFDNDVMIITAIPVSYLLANYFHQKKTRWYHEVLVWIWIASIALLQLYPLLS